jgi:hypothetical protein
MTMENGSPDKNVDRLLLIGGRARSGTTLLRDLCDSHPDITLTHEFGTFLALNEPYPAYRDEILRRWRAQGISRCRVLRSLPMRPKVRSWALSMRGHAFTIRYLAKIRRYRAGPIGFEAIAATLREMFPRPRVLGDKMPHYVHRLDRLAPTSGLANVIIYRDCRDVISSHLKLARTTWRNMAWVRSQDTAEKVAAHWVEAIEAMERHRDRIHVVRYEDLVRDPRRELATLGQWLGVDPAGFSETSIRGVRNDGVGKFAEGLTEQELEEIMRIAGPTMARLGYA